MSSLAFAKSELAAAVRRGVRQCVVIGSRQLLPEAFKSSPAEDFEVFAVDEEGPVDSPATFVPTRFASESLAAALKKSKFDKLRASLFVWLGGVGYRSVDAALASLAFIASLPEGSGVVFDYEAVRISPGSLAHTALDALASRIAEAGGAIKHLIQPQALAALLRGLGFQKVVDVAEQEGQATGDHLVSALV